MTSVQRILFVEDQQDIQAIATIALESIGKFTLKTCSSGQEAIDAAVSFLPDLLLLDVMMPGMDGPTTLTKLREFTQLENTPVIFMTAKVQPTEVAELKALGALDIITKPFDPITLADQIRSIWQQNQQG